MSQCAQHDYDDDDDDHDSDDDDNDNGDHEGGGYDESDHVPLLVQKLKI